MKAKTIIKIILVLLWMSVIFYFSAQTGDESASVSDRLIVKITEAIRRRPLTEEEMNKVVDRFTFVVRKTSHFTEYFILAILVYLTLIDFLPINKKLFLLVILIGLFYATTDEIHQLFVPERAGTIKDVLIDTCGTFIGTSTCLIIHKLKEQKLKNKAV